MVDATEKKVLQRNLAKFMVEEVFNTITAQDVLEVITPTNWKYKGANLTPGQITALRNQAIVLYKSDLWKILKDELTWHAQGRMLDRAKTEEDLISGKMLGYLIKTIDDRLKLMVQDK